MTVKKAVFGFAGFVLVILAIFAALPSSCVGSSAQPNDNQVVYILRIIGLTSILAVFYVLMLTALVAALCLFVKAIPRRHHINTDISISLDGERYKKEFSSIRHKGVVFVKCEISAKATGFLSCCCATPISFSIDTPDWKCQVCECDVNSGYMEKDLVITKQTEFHVLSTRKGETVRLILRCETAEKKPSFVFKLLFEGDVKKYSKVIAFEVDNDSSKNNKEKIC